MLWWLRRVALCDACVPAEPVFEPFFRIEASRNRDTGGIDLDLAAVRAIALDHGTCLVSGRRV
jgi:signal transduction histidine kinase